ncbi:MAG: hypothetical protein ACREHD_05890 [Pirellulales bacterium]
MPTRPSKNRRNQLELRPDGYYELIQWRSLGCLIPAAIVLYLFMRLFDYVANSG